jgi:hypothetical protein
MILKMIFSCVFNTFVFMFISFIRYFFIFITTGIMNRLKDRNSILLNKLNIHSVFDCYITVEHPVQLAYYLAVGKVSCNMHIINLSSSIIIQ